MIIELLLLSLSVSIDSFGIGITYGLKNTKITTIAKFILCLISILITTLSLSLGDFLSYFLPSNIATWLGSFLLIGMGFFLLFECFSTKSSKTPITPSTNLEPSIHEFVIHSLGMTIQIIKNPISSDMDGSKKIDAREAIYLGFALSMDSLCIGIGSSILGVSSFLFPLLVAFFQLCFLSLGGLLGKKIIRSLPVSDKLWNSISGILLVVMGRLKVFGF